MPEYSITYLDNNAVVKNNGSDEDDHCPRRNS